MDVKLTNIPIREALHFLGWKGSPLDEAVLGGVREMIALAVRYAEPRVTLLRRRIQADGELEGTAFIPQGNDVREMLAHCHEGVLIAGTLGAQSERLLLRMQAQDAAKALLLDAALSAGIEAVMDAQEEALRAQLQKEGLYLTDRFSPGYGDMPLTQTREICDILHAQRSIGLTVSASGIMIPRKSVTAVMGISRSPLPCRPKGCAVCEMRNTCALSRD